MNWNSEILRYRNIEILMNWNSEILRYRNIEILKFRKLKYSNIEILKYWNLGSSTLLSWDTTTELPRNTKES